MRTECIIYGDSGNESTPDEAWTIGRGGTHHYCPQADFVLEALGRGPGHCLVVGSPLFEAVELTQAGWSVTYVDVRKPPVELFSQFVQADASTMTLAKTDYDCASSTCVLCHAGLGRYGDPVIKDADELILCNIHAALRPGAFAAITFGPVARMSLPMRFGRCHRIYNIDTARGMACKAGFKILAGKILDTKTNEWVDEFKSSADLGRFYLSMLLEKP